MKSKSKKQQIIDIINNKLGSISVDAIATDILKLDEKPKKQILFTTEDGVNVFENQNVYGVLKDLKNNKGFVGKYCWMPDVFGEYSLRKDIVYL